jgi:FdhD protein
MKEPAQELYTERTIVRYHDGRWSRVEDRVTPERPLYIEINGQQLITLLCSPVQRKALTVGFLYSEGFLQSPEQIINIDLREAEDKIVLELSDITFNMEERIKTITLTSGCGRGTILCDVMDSMKGPKVSGEARFSPEQILEGMKELQKRSSTYLSTGGTHSAAITDGDGLVAFAEDIGRHNAVDKALGTCLLEGIPVTDKAVLASGRISSEIIIKVARSAVPILITRAAATDQVIQIAEALGITLVGFARGRRMNIYACPERVTGDQAL